MSKIKVFAIVMLIAMLAALPVGNALAVSSSDTIGSGTIVNLTLVTDGGITTVMVDLMDGNGLVQTVSVSLETAISSGLVITNTASLASVVTLTDVVDPTLTSTGTINAFDLDDPFIPTLVTVNLTPIPLDVVIDATTAQIYIPSFVLVDPVTFFMTAVDPLDFINPVTLTDMNTLVATTGTVTSITVDDLASATTTVTVNLTPDPTPIDVPVSLEDAVSNGLLIVNPTMIGEMIEIDPTLVIDSTTYSNVVSRLGAFFGSTLGIDFATLEAYHEAGFGYGVITQSLWMATNLGGDAAMLETILQAKLTGDYSTLATTATNLGQFRKEAISNGEQNQGQVISGKAVLPTEETTSATSTTKTNNGNGYSNEKSNNGKVNADTLGNSNKNKP